MVTPPADLERAIAIALRDTNAGAMKPVYAAEAIMYSDSMQAWLRLHAPSVVENTHTGRRIEEGAIVVTCEVAVPDTAQDAVNVLSRIPISATITPNTGTGAILLARWEETR